MAVMVNDELVVGCYPYVKLGSVDANAVCLDESADRVLGRALGLPVATVSHNFRIASCHALCEAEDGKQGDDDCFHFFIS